MVFYHPIPLEDAALAEVLAWGTPRALVVGNHQHGVDAAAFSEKLQVGLYGPRHVERQMRARWPRFAGTLEAVPADDTSRFEALDGTRWGDPVQTVRSAGGVSLVFCDALMANDDADTPFFSRLIGFGGGPRVAPLFRWFLTQDGKALRAHLERLAGLSGLVRLIPCHGKVVAEDAPGVLRRAAAVL